MQDNDPALTNLTAWFGRLFFPREDGSTRGRATEHMDARERAARHWFGYGRWEAPYWFVGAHPGGDDDLAWYQSWVHLGAGQLCDCREHHLGADFTRWHDPENPAPQPTWIPLIQLLLGFLDEAADLNAALAYQRDRWGARDGETALLELSSIRSGTGRTPIEQDIHLHERMALLKARLEQSQPIFVVFYGKSHKQLYETLIGGTFDEEFCYRRPGTLCVLLPQPTARSNPAAMRAGEWWAATGRDMKAQMAASQSRPFSAPAPSHEVQTEMPEPIAARVPENTTHAGSDRLSPEPSDVIRVLVAGNPKQPTSKSYKRSSCYRDGMTVADYESDVRQNLGDDEARKLQADLQWDCSRGFICLERDGRRIDIGISPSMARR